MSATETKNATPLMQQYAAIKQQYPDALLLFQVGDFYELFFDDAKTAAAVLNIALTKRGHMNGEPIPLCGVPLHALDAYLSKLVRAGYKVAICDQLSEPVPGKVVERGVTQVLTPGTLTDSKLLDEKSASYLFSFFPAHDYWGLLFGELLTAQLFATVVPAQAYKQLETELSRFFPDEIIIPDFASSKIFNTYFKNLGYTTTHCVLEDEDQQLGAVRAWLNRQFAPQQVKPLVMYQALQQACAHFYTYMQRMQGAALEQFNSVCFYQPDEYLILDAATQRNLELVKNNQDNTKKNTLFDVLDGAVTYMGSRMIKKWLLRPLVKSDAINARQDVIAHLVVDVTGMQRLEGLLREIGDIERIVGRIALNRASVHDYLSLAQALAQIPELRVQLMCMQDKDLVSRIIAKLADFTSLHTLLVAALNDDRAHEWIIKSGFDEQLDRLRDLIDNSRHKILALEKQEQEATGITSLKIRYNNVQGYYLEVTKPNLPRVPDYYVRVQTLVGRERFVTPALKELQTEIVRARTEIAQVEKAVYERVKKQVYAQLHALRHAAHALAHMDALLGLARVAYNNGYVRPQLSLGHDIVINEGRHPVVEAAHADAFIPNDTQLSDEQSLWIITGPNMGGKSTYLRQVAHICIMAHIGSFVPARSASIAVLDRVFTRIGASDNVADGKSTFLVEMEETALICQQATEKSLVILDEVGRGTSTYDGLAIAQAVIEYIFRQVKARCLFATHYHELTSLADSCPGIVCYHAASKQTLEGIVFLHKIVRGIAQGSFGLEVAKIAGLPTGLIDRAREILQGLSDNNSIMVKPAEQIDSQGNQGPGKACLARFERLDKVDLNELTPRQAMELLWQLKEDTEK